MSTKIFPADATSSTSSSSSSSLSSSSSSTSRRRVVLQPSSKKFSNETQKLAWDHYLKHRPLRNEETDTALGFETDCNGKILRDPITGKPKSTCCGCNSSVRSVKIEEFTDLGPGLALTFRFMQVGTWFFFGAFLLSTIGWITQEVDSKSGTWVDIAWITDLLFTVCFILWMVWLRRDMVIHDDEVDEKDITASDYSVKITNLPPDTTADELAIHFAQFGELYKAAAPLEPNIYDNDFDRTGVCLVRNDAAFIGATFAMVECEKEMNSTDPSNEKEILKMKSKLYDCKKKYEELRALTYTCSGIAFISFRYQDGRNACLTGFKKGTFTYREAHGAENVNRSLTKTCTVTKYRTDIKAVIAPDPNDLLWRNLQNSVCHIFARQCIIGLFSFFYLGGLSWAMAFFAAHSREYQTDGFISLGLLGVLGNVLCCVTSIVLFMPIISTLEGVHCRSTLEIITFLKVGFFQTMGVVIGTLYVFSLDEPAANSRAFSKVQMAAIGSGLPTSNCNIRRFTQYDNVTLKAGEALPPAHMVGISGLDKESCFAYTLHLFGSAMGPYLIGTLVADLALINMIDFLCPPWWVETAGAVAKIFQTDVNKIYEGVDYKPFLRYQILLKFLMTALFLSHIDNPRIMYFWVAACFWQSLEIDRYCYVLRYRTPPYYTSSMVYVVIVYALPVGLLIHTSMHLFFFGLDWSWSEDSGLSVALREGIIPMVTVIFFVIIAMFLLFWFLPLDLWKFGIDRSEQIVMKQNKPQLSRKASAALFRTQTVREEKGTGPEFEAKVAMEMQDLSFEHALVIHENDDLLSHLAFVEVRKYVPDPERREFGVLKLN